jgi:hypothetical protein
VSRAVNTIDFSVFHFPRPSGRRADYNSFSFLKLFQKMNRGAAMPLGKTRQKPAHSRFPSLLFSPLLVLIAAGTPRVCRKHDNFSVG